MAGLTCMSLGRVLKRTMASTSKMAKESAQVTTFEAKLTLSHERVGNVLGECPLWDSRSNTFHWWVCKLPLSHATLQHSSLSTDVNSPFFPQR